MITIFIDNRPYEVNADQNLLQACLSLGFDLPYFCWHPALHAVGACRQCAVKQFKDEHDTRGRIVMSCMTPVAEGMRISVDDPEARAFRGSVIEWLMLNHPHDCPVCDEGGECHLQDMTVMTGHAYRRSRFPKRTHRNQDLGPFINHEMNRCIQCYRCVRYYRDVAGGRDLHVFGAHDNVYFGRHEDGALESPFSGNLVEICPTGVFTDKTLKQHYTRKWDLQSAPSVCIHCGIGCNTIAGERYGTLRRILNRYHHEVNGYFLCDRGRFGYEFVNSEDRIRSASMVMPAKPGLAAVAKGTHDAGKDAVLAHIAAVLSEAKGVIGIGSPRASLESNFALRALVGPENFHTGMSDRELRLVSAIIDIYRSGISRTASLREVREADAMLVLGEDVTNTAPLLALSLRQAVRNRSFEIADERKTPRWLDAAVRNMAQEERSPLFVITTGNTALDDVAARTWRAAPADIARFGFAVAHALDPAAPDADGLAQDTAGFVREVAAALKTAKRPLIVSGTGCLSEAMIRAAANIAWALSRSGVDAALSYAVPECNTLGLGLLGGRSLGEAVTRVHEGLADTVVIVENDLTRRASPGTVEAFLSKAKRVIVLDHLRNATTDRAEVVLPASTFAEEAGTIVNNEGRAQRYFQVYVPQGEIQAAWKWLDDIGRTAKKAADGNRPLQLDGLLERLAAELPLFAPLRDIAPPATFRIKGQKVPRQSHRYSGRTAMTANISVREPKPPEDPDSPLAYSMEGSQLEPPAPLIARYWAPGWNSVQALNRFQQEVSGPIRSGPAGIRLIETAKQAEFSYFQAPPEAEATGNSELQDCHIFSSEELSARAPGIMERRSLEKK